MKKLSISYAVIGLLAVSGCGKKNDDAEPAATTGATVAPVGAAPAATVEETPTTTVKATPNPTDLTSNLSRASAALAAGTPHIKLSASLALNENPSFNLTTKGLGTIWETADTMFDPAWEGDRAATPKINLKNYMGTVLDETLPGALGPISSFNNSMYIFCVLDQFLPTKDDTGLAADGVYPITFDLADASVVKNCTGNKDGKSQSGTDTATITVTSTSDQTIFRKKYVIEDSEGKLQTIYLKTGADGTFNLAGIEPQPGTDRDCNSRTMLKIDPVADTVSYESTGQCWGQNASGGGTDRIFIDNRTHVGSILHSQPSDATHYINWAVGGETTSKGNGLVVSFTAKGVPSGDYTDDYNACVSDSDGAIKTDDTLTCGGATLPAISAATVFQANIDAHVDMKSYTLNETSDLPFTSAAEMFTKVWAH